MAVSPIDPIKAVAANPTSLEPKTPVGGPNAPSFGESPDDVFAEFGLDVV